MLDHVTFWWPNQKAVMPSLLGCGPDYHTSNT